MIKLNITTGDVAIAAGLLDDEATEATFNVYMPDEAFLSITPTRVSLAAGYSLVSDTATVADIYVIGTEASEVTINYVEFISVNRPVAIE